ncbi:hypothetical protein DW797_10705 [Ruminococcus sp. AM31-32]|jgi:hypothetical protein|uniref:hypothetical protein n=1 Tax=Agathobacter rectalis TaxID=39491 RepID=UPI000E52C4BE|nr:hypothetical protein [Ruminococcus sp. AM31-32]RGH62711.1 hypothetical protein DW797_10705 [Ruminococcus sp. AM31-32]RHD33302.1 hypothetical protein DW798_14295 [Agathobacter rectalis]
MYKMVIKIKNDVSMELRSIIENAFLNRGGNVKNTSKDTLVFEFKANEKERGCLDLGICALVDNNLFMASVDTLEWIDEENPDESCDVLQELQQL